MRGRERGSDEEGRTMEFHRHLLGKWLQAAYYPWLLLQSQFLLSSSRLRGLPINNPLASESRPLMIR